MNRYADNFIHKYKVSKTLRFELKPVGKTSEMLDKLIKGETEDSRRAEFYPVVKEVLDKLHKQLIERALSKVEMDWSALEACLQKKEDKDTQEKVLEVYRKEILKALEKDSIYKELLETTPKKIFSRILADKESLTEEEAKAVNAFKGFATYFTGFQENRKNFYSSEEKHTAIPYRVVNENYPKFSSNMGIYHFIKTTAPEVLKNTEATLAETLNGVSLESYFEANAFNKCLNQSGIRFYNELLGGYTKENGEKIQGINEHINLYNQQHPENKLKRMVPLFKQILSDRETRSFVPQQFADDPSVWKSIDELRKFLNANFLGRIQVLLGQLSGSLEDVYLQQESLSFVSKEVTGQWNSIQEALEGVAAEMSKKASKEFLKQEAYSLKSLSELSLLKPSDAEGTFEEVSIATYWSASVIEKYTNAIRMTEEALNTVDMSAPNLRDSQAADDESSPVIKLKAYLDAALALIHYLKPFRTEAVLKRNADFYLPFDEIYEQLTDVIALYNKVRNYVTQKRTDSSKMKLMFNCGTLADGWDENKLSANKAFLLARGGCYYVGIFLPTSKTQDIEAFQIDYKTNEEVYQRMVYKYLPGPNKMLPKVFRAKSNHHLYGDIFDPLSEGYEAKMHTHGKTFDLTFCHRYIDACKACIARHEDWKRFDFKFSETSTYQGVDAFYKEVADQGYKVNFVNLPIEMVEDAVESGKLCLFQIYNKDFSPHAKGKPNLHTLYWKMLFVEENLKDVILKLNGEAELFYRAASLKEKTEHRTGEKMVNRRTKDGKVLPEHIHEELYKQANGRIKVLSAEAERWRNKAVIKDVKHTIVKDRRYTEPKIFFHVPLTFNFKAPERPSINKEIRAALKGNPDVNIIGLDRGERNLLYLSLINQRGEILEQKSFNIVAQTDYHALLNDREKSRDAARKSWGKIEKIKEIKEGYLSAVIHEITKMMIEHNAIVILEDLNVGFKRGRFKVEKQIYQKFEKMLIDKLNYLAFKDCEMCDAGSILHGYQLTEKFESFKKIGKQTGALFYVPAGYTSKIDPCTGFVDLFKMNAYKKNTETKKAFFAKFKRIVYDKSRDAFAFTFDYKDFETHQGQKGAVTRWTVYSATKRIVYSKTKRKYLIINPTQEIKEILGACEGDLRDAIAILDAKALDKVFYAFVRTLQMRNSNDEEDYIESPVEYMEGIHFDSRTVVDGKCPIDADANGAYHIALKGLYLLRQLAETEEDKLPLVENEKWFSFMQRQAWKA